MVQREEVTLYGKTQDELLEWVYLCEKSPSGLRWRKRASSTAPKDGVAGTFSETVRFPCWRIKIDKTPMIVSRVIWFLCHKEVPEVLDHINGNPKDNSVENLRDVPTVVNCENRVVDNPWGVPGISLLTSFGGNQWFRSQGTTRGGRWAKTFPVKKWGFETALSKAIEFRLEMEDKHGIETRRVSSK